MNSEVYRGILSTQMHPTTAKLIGQQFMVQIDNAPARYSSMAK